jgi:predicted ATPase
LIDEDEYSAEHDSDATGSNFFVVTGCSGGGKSTLLSELARRGYPVYPEPGRQIVKEQLSVGGDGLPWQNATRFVELCVSRAMHFYILAKQHGQPVFFDRSMIDNITGMERLGMSMPDYLPRVIERYRYAKRVFMVPPWPEIFAQDTERRHVFAEAVQEFDWLEKAYPAKGYEVMLIPKMAVVARANFVERSCFDILDK